MSTHVILLLCLSFGGGLRVVQLCSALYRMLRTQNGRIPEILIQPDAAALVQRVRRGIRWVGDVTLAALSQPVAAAP